MPPICTHVDHVRITQLPESVDGCVDCLAMGSLWLHLRICLECGHVGCCDDSPNRHATAHARRDEPPDHPLARAGRGLVLVLRRRGRHAHPGRARDDAHPAVAAARVSGATAGRLPRPVPGACAPRSGRSARPATRGTRCPCRRGGRPSTRRRSIARASSSDRARCRSCCSGRVSGSTGDGSWRSCKASRCEAARRRLS